MMLSRISDTVDHLVWFGDSWPAGVPGSIDQAFPALIGNNLGITSLNYSRPGSSIPELLIQFNQWKTQGYQTDKKYILIVCLTNDNRFYWKNDGGWFNVSPWNAEFENSKYFYKHTYNREAVDFYNTCCIGHLKNLTSECNIPLYFLRNFKNMHDDCKRHSIFDTGLVQFLLDNPDAIWSEDMKTQIVKEKIGKGLFTDCAHPNAHGHKKLADLLTDKLQVIINSTS
jgi:hypothetical protein